MVHVHFLPVSAHIFSFPTPSSPRCASSPLALHVQVLRYQVYTMEEVPDNAAEPLRARVFELAFHTVDGTLRLFEPALANSGLQQASGASRPHSNSERGRRRCL